MATLSSKLNDIRSDLEQFAISKKIDVRKVSNYSEIIEIAHDKKLDWALSDKFDPLKSIQIYRSYKLIYESLLSARGLLLASEKRGKSYEITKILLPYFQKLIIFTKMLEKELSVGNKAGDFNKIEYMADSLRSYGISLKIVSPTEKVDGRIYRNIRKTATNITMQ